jgi:short subunit fatty acids transporter
VSTPFDQEFVKTVAATVSIGVTFYALVSWGAGLSSSMAQLQADMTEIKAGMRESQALLLTIAALLASSAIAKALSPSDRTTK